MGYAARSRHYRGPFPWIFARHINDPAFLPKRQRIMPNALVDRLTTVMVAAER